MSLSTLVTVTVWLDPHLAGAKVRVEGDSVTTDEALAIRSTLTSAVGWLASATV